MNDEPGVARLTYRRIKAATGVTDLPALEEQVADLEVAVAENRSLEGPLLAAIERVEQALVPVLESRSRRGGREQTDVP